MWQRHWQSPLRHKEQQVRARQASHGQGDATQEDEVHDVTLVHVRDLSWDGSCADNGRPGPHRPGGPHGLGGAECSAVV